MPRTARTITIGSLLFVALVSVTTLHFKSQSQVQVPPGLRAQRDTWTPLMDVLKEKGRPRATDEQLAKMKALPIEAMWGAAQGKGYRFCFVNHLKATQPGVNMVGRELTMQDLRAHRHLVVRESGTTRTARPVIEAVQRWTVGHMATSMQAVIKGYGYAWFPEEKILEELTAGTLKQLPMRDGGERYGQLYLVFADRDAAGPGTLRLAEIIRERTAATCEKH